MGEKGYSEPQGNSPQALVSLRGAGVLSPSQEMASVGLRIYGWRQRLMP